MLFCRTVRSYYRLQVRALVFYADPPSYFSPLRPFFLYDRAGLLLGKVFEDNQFRGDVHDGLRKNVGGRNAILFD